MLARVGPVQVKEIVIGLRGESVCFDLGIGRPIAGRVATWLRREGVGLGGVARTEAALLLDLAEDGAQVIGDPSPETEDSRLWMLVRSCHR
jgi:hypothetical protein